MKSYVISNAELKDWISGLIKKQEVIAPVKQENFTNFKKISAFEEIVWGGPQTVIPPKQFLYPQSEELLAYQFGPEGVAVEGLNSAPARVLLGVHPCDLNGIFQMDQVFGEKNLDENYLNKRKLVILVGMDCLRPCTPESICYRMGGLDPKGRFDVFLTDLGGSFFVEAASEKGEKLTGELGAPATEADRKKLAAARRDREALFDREQKPLLPKLSDLPRLLKENYNSPEWEERGQKDYACGSCNMVCPTCYCFDVQDFEHISRLRGVRTRFWDGCMLTDFAKVGSGENFREDRSSRLRHRTNRKLNYLFEKWGESFCTGCGRCIKACLTKIVSPLEIANALFERGKK